MQARDKRGEVCTQASGRIPFGLCAIGGPCSTLVRALRPASFAYGPPARPPHPPFLAPSRLQEKGRGRPSRPRDSPFACSRFLLVL